MKFLRIALPSLVLATATPILAADHQVQMLNQGESGLMVFEPAFIEAMPGDTVTFVATDASHNAETIKSMLPAGAETFKGPFNKDFTITVTEEGVYGVKCAPHYSMGMIALISVGEPTNLAEAMAVKLPNKAQERMLPMLESLR